MADMSKFGIVFQQDNRQLRLLIDGLTIDKIKEAFDKSLKNADLIQVEELN